MNRSTKQNVFDHFRLVYFIPASDIVFKKNAFLLSGFSSLGAEFRKEILTNEYKGTVYAICKVKIIPEIQSNHRVL